MPFAYCKNIMLNFSEMLLLQPLEYYELVLREVSRLYVKEMPEKNCGENKICVKNV